MTGDRPPRAAHLCSTTVLTALPLLAVLVLAYALAAVADERRLKRTSEDSGHDLRASPESPPITLCGFCHLPHQPPAASAIDPAWDPRLPSVATYVLEEGGSPAGVPAALGDRTTQDSLCVGCHDGSVAAATVYTDIGVHPAAFMEQGHPVDVVYDAAVARRNGKLVVPTSLSSVGLGEDIPLFEGRLRCASCHDAHNGAGDSEGLFLRRRRAPQQTLCLECHV